MMIRTVSGLQLSYIMMTRNSLAAIIIINKQDNRIVGPLEYWNMKIVRHETLGYDIYI